MRGIQVLEWRDVTGDQIVHRVPEEGPGDVNLGAQLTVRESQAAVFFRDGQSLDVFGPGRHTLTALNLRKDSHLLSTCQPGKEQNKTYPNNIFSQIPIH